VAPSLICPRGLAAVSLTSARALAASESTRRAPGKSEAYALASMAVSFRVMQYADQTASAYTSTPPKAVHAVIPKAIFPPVLHDQIQRWLRPGTAAGR
jgi:hypothetical protein